MSYFYWSDGNAKLIKTAKAWQKRFGKEAKFLSFNIPRLESEDGLKTCPYAGMCADICYADQGRMAMSMATGVREDNLRKIRELTQSDLIEAISTDIRNMRKTTHIRIHDSGDFYSRTYYKSWIRIAECCNDIIFYAYTKSIPFLDWDLHPRNFRIVQSLGGKRDADIDLDKPHAKIFATETERLRSEYCNGNLSDMPAIIGQLRIGLVYHGTRYLTNDNLVKLRVRDENQEKEKA